MKQQERVLVTGAQGQLGLDMVQALEAKGYAVIACSRKEMDVTDMDEVMEVMDRERPAAVIHASAYTKVDLAETERDEVYRVNVYGTRNVAVASQQIGAKMVYVSTDYVFDGRTGKAYDEFARPHPINVYGRSKWEGEQMVRQFQLRSFIVRTSWLFSKNGDNFVKTMLKQGKEQRELKVVHDQVGSPTYTADLAAAIIRLLGTDRYGTYHITNQGVCSWHELACAIMEEAGFNVMVRSVPTSQFPRPARRPAYSALEGRALRLNGFPALRHWREALADCMSELKPQA
ncbi:dTDP-4-dehydrorhamnose reductase [Paenibacillus marinisediminis]